MASLGSAAAGEPATGAEAEPGPPAPPPPPPPPPAPSPSALGPLLPLQREPLYNWQATKPTVQERFAFLFNNEVLCDVHFLVGKGLSSQRVPAHRWAAGTRPDPATPDPASPDPEPHPDPAPQEPAP